MDVRGALKQQYHAGLAMLRQCIERCPDDLWAADRPDTSADGIVDRAYWRIVLHGLYFTHLYLGQGEDALRPPPADSAIGGRKDFKGMWGPPPSEEPYDFPLGTPACSRAEALEYLAYVDGIVNETVDGLDLETEESGFHWYRNITKLSHQILNVRHVQGHVGQLSELLMLRGIDTDWNSRG